MNEKLFKKLNEQVELVSIKNSIKISESDETKLIFDGIDFLNLVEAEFNGYKHAMNNKENARKFDEWYGDKKARRNDFAAPDGYETREEKKEEKKAVADEEAEKKKKEAEKADLAKKKQDEYNAAFKRLDFDAQYVAEKINDILLAIESLKKKLSTAADDAERKEIKERITDARKKLDSLVDKADALYDKLREINFSTPTGISVRTEFSDLTRELRAKAKRLQYE